MKSDNNFRNSAIVYFIYVLIIVLWANNWITLWDQDEAAYAGFAKNMIESGNYLIPDFMWSDIHRKTPLHFWTICLSFKIFGYNEFAVRFPSAIYVWLTIVMIYVFGKKIFGEKESFISSIVLSTTFLVMGLAKIAVTDAGILFYSTLCGFSLLHILLFRKKQHVIIFWISFSLAVLTKGPPILIFTIIFGTTLCIFHPNRRNLILLHPWIFMPLAILPLVYWGYLCSKTPNGKLFIDWLIDWYILKRVGGSVLGQTGPIGSHLMGILVIFIGYFVWVPKSIINSIKNWRINKNYTDGILIGWFVAGWLIYEFSPSKLPSYVITAHVPLAMMIGKTMVNNTQAPKKYLKIIQSVIYCIIILAIAAVPVVFKLTSLQTITFFVISLLLATLYILIQFKSENIGLINNLNFLRSLQPYAQKMILFNILFHICCWGIILPMTNNLKNVTYLTAEFIQQHANKEAMVVIANNHAHPPSLPFYLKQHFSNVVEEYDLANLQMKYFSSKNIVIILNENQLLEFQKKDPNIAFHEIKPFDSEFISSKSYYIIYH